MGKFYITTAIDYPSGPPHIGHAYEKIVADCIARWRRMQGEEVFFLTGTDEHGQKIVKYASQAGKTPQEFVDATSAEFKRMCGALNISNDDFIRTTEKRHGEACKLLFSKLQENGDIYPGEYEGLYCVDCEAFYTPKDLPGGNCPVHLSPVEKVKENSYFFKMQAYSGRLIEHIKRNSRFILPLSRRNEIINRLNAGVKDLCISRSSFKWGVELPGNPEHVIFVWFDALSNYISALGYPSGKFSRYWPCDLHIIGKDILWFHAVVWPSILMAAGLELPEQIFVHGFINVDGMKLSKSRGVSINLNELISKYGADALRYFLIREVPLGEDGSFSEPALVNRLNNDLANDLGNLLSRTLSMVEKYFSGRIPAPSEKAPLDKETDSAALTARDETDRHMRDLCLGEALDSVWKLISRLNKYVEQTAPWTLDKAKDTRRLGTVLFTLADNIVKLAFLLSPFMPETSEEIFRQMGAEKPLSGRDPGRFFLEPAVSEQQTVSKGENLFTKITTGALR